MTLQILGITGFKGSGKTTVGRMLSSELRLPVFHLADPIKDIVHTLDPYDSKGVRVSSYMEGGEAMVKAHHDEYRRSLRVIGEGIRKARPSFWIEVLEDRARGHPDVIVPDIRFPLEAECCATIINVVRPGIESDGDETEQDMSMFAYKEIINDGSLGDLAGKVERLMHDLELEPISVY